MKKIETIDCQKFIRGFIKNSEFSNLEHEEYLAIVKWLNQCILEKE